MKICCIASGSSGNCIYIGSDATHILIDAGVSCKRIKEGLASIGVSLETIDGIFITHEHSDHVAGLGVISKNYHIPIYCTQGTMNGILCSKAKNLPDEALFHIIKAEERYNLKDLLIHPMWISHDAADPLAYRVYYGSKKVAVITDLGYYNDYTVAALTGMNALVLEANHDVNMLQVGPYPYHLKRRILGDRGHLSNENAGKLLSRIVHKKLQAVILGHLSKENNLPELAYEAVRVEVTMSDAPFSGDDIPLYVACRDKPSQMILL